MPDIEMSKAHLISLKTREQIWNVIRKHKLDPEILESYGLIDRIIRGQLICEEGKVRKHWNPAVRSEYDSWVASVEVDSSSRDGHAYLLGVLVRSLVVEKEVKQFHSPPCKEKKVYEIESIGKECKFLGTRIPSHTCEDALYQGGLKALPTVCMHRVAAGMFYYDTASRQLEQSPENIFLLPMYESVGEDVVSFYHEIENHKMTAAQRLDLLYRFVKGEIKSYRIGKEFLKSVGLRK